MAARDEILSKLRNTLARPDLRFPPAQVEPLTPASRMTVTRAEGDALALAQRFGAELQKLHGAFEIVESVAEARLALITRLRAWMAEEAQNAKGVRLGVEQERSVLSWAPEALPIPGLAEALTDMGIPLVTPNELYSAQSREAVRYIRYGLTGVEAAFASTGSLLVAASPQRYRAASLLPLRHIALIPFERLYPTMESWLLQQRQQGSLVDFWRTYSNIVMISGPSKSADIEMNLTLGVHGPKYLYAILFGKVDE
jgi:L-lactate dehydrogenase complex protein LldG